MSHELVMNLKKFCHGSHPVVEMVSCSISLLFANSDLGNIVYVLIHRSPFDIDWHESSNNKIS
jgi:hypothetical protein